jgi:hypothetical protein
MFESFAGQKWCLSESTYFVVALDVPAWHGNRCENEVMRFAVKKDTPRSIDEKD